ncbi:MAG: CvpA family protein [Wenzhouxiangella sp.]
MSGADIAILAVCAVSMLVSLFRGFIREVFSLIVWVLAVYAALYAANPLSERMAPWIEMPSIRLIIGFVGVFVLVLLVGGLVNYLLGKLVASTGLSGTDRMVGALFGALRGVAIILVAVIIARMTPFPEDPWWQESRLLPQFERLAITAVQHFPETMREYVAPELPPEQP